MGWVGHNGMTGTSPGACSKVPTLPTGDRGDPEDVSSSCWHNEGGPSRGCAPKQLPSACRSSAGCKGLIYCMQGGIPTCAVTKGA